MKTVVVIVAGGSGTRFGAQVPKQFLELGGKPVLMRTISTFEQALAGCGHEIVVTLPDAQQAFWRDLCGRYTFTVPHRVVDGGQTRWHSVKNALVSLSGHNGIDVIAVHDGVRPLVSIDLIGRALATAREKGSAVPVVPLNDSVRQIADDGSHALDRSMLRAVQTPQVFNAEMLIEAYKQPFDPAFTDDASVVERLGRQVTLVEGDPCNLKITRPMDLALAEYLLNDA